jgi:hypothetical protein
MEAVNYRTGIPGDCSVVAVRLAAAAGSKGKKKKKPRER